jgi:hypothetical protein
MSEGMGTRQVWDSLVARISDPRARAIGERFSEAAEAVKAAATTRDDVLRRYLGSDYDAVIERTEDLALEDASRIISDRVMARIADETLSSADVRAISDAIARLGELDQALGEALDGLYAVFEEAAEFLRSESSR